MPVIALGFVVGVIEPVQELIGDRAGHSQLAAIGIVFRCVQIHPPLELLRGALGDIADRAAEGVASEQGALRALHHFHPLQIIQAHADQLPRPGTREGVGGHVDPVDEDGDVAAPGQLGDAANVRPDIAAAYAPVVRQARGQFGDVDSAGDAQAFDLLETDGADGERNVLQ